MTTARTPASTHAQLPGEVEQFFDTYKPLLLDTAAWAQAKRTVLSCVRAVQPQTVYAARDYAQALLHYLAGPSGWDRTSAPDLAELLTDERVRDAYADPALGKLSTRRGRTFALKALARSAGYQEPRQPQHPPVELALDGPTLFFPALEPRERTDDLEAARRTIDRYTPRRSTLDADRWTRAAEVVRAAASAAAPRNTYDAGRVLSALAGFVGDPIVWDGRQAPDMLELLRLPVIAGHVQRVRFGSENSRRGRQQTLHEVGRALGTVVEVGSRQPQALPYDPFVMALGQTAVPLTAVAAARAMTSPAPTSKLNLDRAAKDFVEARDVAARQYGTGTVWAVSALVALTEVTSKPLGVTVNTSHDTGPMPKSTSRPKSRRARLAAAKEARTRAERAASLDAAPELALADEPDVDKSIRNAIAAYMPARKTDRGVWETNRVLAERLVLAYEPTSHRNAQNICAFVRPFLAWHATFGGRDANIPLTIDGLLTPERIEEYLTASGWSDGSKSGARSVLRRIHRNLYPHRAPVTLAHQRMAPPYSSEECATLVRQAWHQPTEKSQRRLAFIIALSLGAGLDAEDLRHVQRQHIESVDVDGRTVYVVTVTGRNARSRTVPVRAEYVPLLERALSAHDTTEGLTSNDLLVANATTTVNVVSRHLRDAKGNALTFQVKTNRLRHTWLVAAMTSPVSLADLLQAAGLKSARSFTDLLEHCPPADPAKVALALAAYDESRA
jgi:hypothetical protein